MKRQTGEKQKPACHVEGMGSPTAFPWVGRTEEMLLERSTWLWRQLGTLRFPIISPKQKN